MKYFSAEAFEKLLFPLHKNVYLGIDRAFEKLESSKVGAIKCISDLYERSQSKSTVETIEVNDFVKANGLPVFDIRIDIREKDLSRLRKTDNYTSTLVHHSAYGQVKPGVLNVHLIVNVLGTKQNNAFIIPLAYVLQEFKDRVVKSNNYQLYRHNLIKKPRIEAAQALTLDEYVADSGIYIGITKRSWQERYREHMYAARRCSQIRFHRALRGELFDVDVYEHEILRAGLTSKEALRLEELEVEKYSLFSPINPCGLNMIPGGEAGIKFIASMRRKKIKEIDPDKMELELEEYINETLRQSGLDTSGRYKNERLAERWKTNINYQIAVITGNQKRLSYNQIWCARVWHASGWSLDKIRQKLTGIDGRSPTEEQLAMMLAGKTYERVPHVMVEDGD